MRRSSYVARTLVLGIIADDIFGALINASSNARDRNPTGEILARRREATLKENRLVEFDDSPYCDRLAA
jgi:hypothetical protein